MNLKEIGKRIKYARENAGLTQEQLAEAIDMSPMHISVIERGVKAPKLETFIRIANTLQVSADDLLQDCLDSAIPVQANKLSVLLNELPEKEQKCLLNSLEAFIHTFEES